MYDKAYGFELISVEVNLVNTEGMVRLLRYKPKNKSFFFFLTMLFFSFGSLSQHHGMEKDQYHRVCESPKTGSSVYCVKYNVKQSCFGNWQLLGNFTLSVHFPKCNFRHSCCLNWKDHFDMNDSI